MHEDGVFQQCERCELLYFEDRFPVDPKDPERKYGLCSECIGFLAKRFKRRREAAMEQFQKKRRLLSKGTTGDARLNEVYDEIIEGLGDLVELPDIELPPCVYFLLFHDEVTFVGQAKHLVLALHRHWRSGDFFERVLYLPVPEEHLNRVLRAFVKWLRPVDNRQRYVRYRLNEDEKKLIVSVPSVSDIWDILDSRRRVDWT